MRWLRALLPATPTQAAELDEVHAALIENIWQGGLWITLIGVPASLTRAFSTGWLPLYSLFLAIGLGYLALHSQRHRLSWRLKGLILNSIFWCVGMAALVSLGLLGTGLLWLLVSCMLMALIYPPRVALLGVLAAVLLMSGVGAGFSSGMLRLSFDPQHYMVTPSAWLATLLTTMAVVALVLTALVSFRQALLGMLAELQRQRDLIAQQAIHDPLTGLPNLSLATDRLNMALHAAARSQARVGLLFIDLDGFKDANDRHGHAAGDAVLKEVARRLQQALRARDTAARIGGDEFLVVLSELSDAQAATAVAEKLVQSLAAPIDTAEAQLHIGCSIGISLYPDHGDNSGLLRRRADLAMYTVKRNGKGGCALFDAAGMETNAAPRPSSPAQT